MSIIDIPQLENFSLEEVTRACQLLMSQFEADARSNAKSDAAFQELRARWTGRKAGVLQQVMTEWLKKSPPNAKRDVGQKLNSLKQAIETQLEQLAARASESSEKAATARERIDVTLPGVSRKLGAEHPVIKTMNEIVSVFRNMGYSVATGPEIETDYYNFEALNFPPNHPARDTQDTLIVAGQSSKQLRERLLLRTHTSPVQIRTMESQRPPVRVVCPGKVHRNDAADATHSPIFHQVEGLAVDENITFSDLKGTLDHAMKMLFGSSVKTRFYPSFFPFTEPSADVQISCPFCGGKGCRPCKQSGWIELLGCGMVDPAVFGFVDYDPDKVSGFAFGMGVERIAMMKYGINDIQLFYSGDVRFLEQFA
ncbi:MAG: phenylalanine--tRNA ligase subunit alpha [Acidobacteriales bacterium]|nr:phenylalanine--tRNA ligase subunit alpha [Terriglobales bacterium]